MKLRGPYRTLGKQLIEQGCELRSSSRNVHIKVYKDGKLICVLPSTPSDWRGYKNCISQLRRAGLSIQ